MQGVDLARAGAGTRSQQGAAFGFRAAEGDGTKIQKVRVGIILLLRVEACVLFLFDGNGKLQASGNASRLQDFH